MPKSTKLPSKRSDKERVKKIDEMYRSIEAACFLHIDDQADAIYMASLLLTTAKNQFMQFLPKERVTNIFQLVVDDLKAQETQ